MARHGDATPTGPRIGLLGGSFDPPHLAHRALGIAALQQLELEELRWLPAGSPWQKAGRVLAPAEKRLAMLELLTRDIDGSVIDDRELRRDGPTYTLDSVRELQRERPGAEWFLVIGQDQFQRLDTWHGFAELLQRLTLAVAAREGDEPRPPPALAALDFRWQRLLLPRIDISASAVRRRRAAGEPIGALVGDAVAGYIEKNNLYTGAHDGTHGMHGH